MKSGQLRPNNAEACLVLASGKLVLQKTEHIFLGLIPCAGCPLQSQAINIATLALGGITDRG